jgi:hypothetical protein
MPFIWSERTNRYRDTVSGKFVPTQVVRNAVDVVIRATGDRLTTLTRGLQTGTIPLDVWQTTVAQEIKNLHLATAAAAAGGWQQMSPAMNGWTGQRIRTQYEFLRSFAEDIASGKQKMDGTLVVRASLYADAARGTNREMERRMARLGGLQSEKNVLGAADHCSGCLSATSQGWVPIGTLTPVGQRSPCLARCHCHLDYRMAA